MKDALRKRPKPHHAKAVTRKNAEKFYPVALWHESVGEPEKACAVLKALVACDYPPAEAKMFEFAIKFFKGKKWGLAYEALTFLSNQHNLKAHYLLWQMYHLGIGQNVNSSKAYFYERRYFHQSENLDEEVIQDLNSLIQQIVKEISQTVILRENARLRRQAVNPPSIVSTVQYRVPPEAAPRNGKKQQVSACLYFFSFFKYICCCSRSPKSQDVVKQDINP